MIPDNKLCTLCNQVKPSTDYYGRHTRCKICFYQLKREYLTRKKSEAKKSSSHQNTTASDWRGES